MHTLFGELRLLSTVGALWWIRGHSSGTHVLLFWVFDGHLETDVYKQNYFQSCGCVTQYIILRVKDPRSQ